MGLAEQMFLTGHAAAPVKHNPTRKRGSVPRLRVGLGYSSLPLALNIFKILSNRIARALNHLAITVVASGIQSAIGNCIFDRA